MRQFRNVTLTVITSMKLQPHHAEKHLAILKLILNKETGGNFTVWAPASDKPDLTLHLSFRCTTKLHKAPFTASAPEAAEAASSQVTVLQVPKLRYLLLWAPAGCRCTGSSGRRAGPAAPSTGWSRTRSAASRWRRSRAALPKYHWGTRCVHCCGAGLDQSSSGPHKAQAVNSGEHHTCEVVKAMFLQKCSQLFTVKGMNSLLPSHPTTQ